MERTEGASWARKRRRVADEAFMVRVWGRGGGLWVVVRVVASSAAEDLGWLGSRSRKREAGKK